ncbi:MAG: type II toxin-antitoxin system HicB family antitoxin [Phycisphaerae bacterium]|jgi:predicted RNase H-like HicB family nuclease|nr:type II toxin-antitoxin system HicB family antitoxin [Phycisphaerae bacterium]
MRNAPFRFEGFVLRSGRKYESICPDLDVASFGKTPADARRSLLEACRLHVESAIECNLPYLRPMPPDDHPLREEPSRIVERFMVKIEIAVRAHA